MKVRAQEAATHIVGGPPDEVVLVQPGTVPKTASGKIRRAAARDLYLGKNLAVPQRALWWQLARLSFAGLGVRISQVRRSIGAAALCRLVVDRDRRPASCWLACRDDAAAPDLAMERRSARWLAPHSRRFGVPVSVTGIDRIPRGGAVLAFNHASYMDAVVVAAVLPGEPTYVVKKELASQVFAGPMLRRLGVLFLERFERHRQPCRPRERHRGARQKRLLVFFPEGTFTRRAGLSGFYLGAFRVAAQAKLPVVPGDHARNAIDAARRAVVPAMESGQRHHRGSRFKPPEPISPRWCDCATPSAPSCWPVAGSPIWAN